MNTDFDEYLGKVTVIPQDIGRVLLNLITNAFYAVSSKAKATEDAINEKKQEGLEEYVPTVSISTIKSDKTIVISIKDNGNGIPDSIKEKIFQPFFTTKPAGQGTGLGLSLAYDIIKAHDGKLTVESEEGNRTEFKIHIPI